MNWLDYVVLITTMVGIAVYGIWRTRGPRDLNTYLKGARDTPWFVIGLSVMATQALIEGGVSRRDRKASVDQVSAVLILQNYLDYRKQATA